MPKKTGKAKRVNILGTRVLFNGVPFDPDPPSPTFLKIKDYLDKNSNKGVFSAEALVERLKVSGSSITKFVLRKEYAPYFYRFGPHKQLALGHPKEVKRFAKCFLSTGESE